MASDHPIIPSPDPDIAKGAVHCVHGINGDPVSVTPMAVLRPYCPYLAAYLGARHLDLIRDWRRAGGAGWVSTAVCGGKSPLVELRPAGTAQDLAEMVLGTSVTARIPTDVLAAALITLGFPLAGLTAAGVVQVMGIFPNGDSWAPQTAESLLAAGLSFQAAEAAAEALEGEIVRQQGRAAEADGVARGEKGGLSDGHLFHWAYMGAVRRASLAPVEQAMGYDSAKLRSHILEPKGRVNDGLSVICTAEEYKANEGRILRHLRGH